MGYLLDHVPHILVVLGFIAYPGIYTVLTSISEVFGIFMPSVDVMIAVLFFGLFAMSFDFISGYTGYLSLGHAAFYGTGAYMVILIANGKIPLLASSTPFMLSLVIAGVVAAVLALIIGSVSFRLRGFYFAMITLGFSQVLYAFVRRWGYLVYGQGNPADGVRVAASQHSEGFEIGIPFFDFANLTFDNEMLAIGQLAGDPVDNFLTIQMLDFSRAEVSYFLVGGVVLICYFVMQRIIHSPFGQVMVAIRENEERAEAVGLNVYWYKMAAFAVSAFFAAVGGGLYAGYERSASPENFFFMETADAILATVLGGLGTLAGPIFGETIRLFIETILNNTAEKGIIPDIFAGHEILLLGIFFILIVLYVPGGILGVIRSWAGGKISKQFGNLFR
ncbi:MAG: branched-chain amino acid ABC transporter permease [Halobacteria archaeon]|nr:branched-chain amino acid ABC transporter permease [Halobacteria archaeon]